MLEILSPCLVVTDKHFFENSKDVEKLPNSKRKRLSPEKLSPTRPVPSHIPRPPYITSKTPPGIASGLEVHDEKGI